MPGSIPRMPDVTVCSEADSPPPPGLEVAPLVRRTVRRYVACRTLAEDIVQEVLLRVHLGRAAFRGHGNDGREQAFARWCMTVARNTAIDGVRRERRHGFVTDADPDRLIGSDDPESVAIERERLQLLRQRVRTAVAALPPGARQVVTLHKLEGQRMDDVAASLGVRVGTARVRAHRGYVALGRSLAVLPE